MRKFWPARADTLFLRLFVLMWVALVASHLAAYFVAHGGTLGTGDLPTLPSLPPNDLPFSHASRGDNPGPPPPPLGERVPPDAGLQSPGAPPRPGSERGAGPDTMADSGPGSGPRGGPTLWVDYAVRLLVIGLFAGIGARWLSAPMRRLASTSRSLGASLARGEPPLEIDERRGTVEVRETARVFNDMVRRLHEQFASRTLFMAAISHDLRTPLTRLRLRLEQRRDDAVIEAGIGDLREMDALIEAVLSTLRDERTQEAPQALDVYALMQSMVDDEVDQGHAASVQGEPAIVRAQPVALRRTLGNLLVNALRHGGSADVRVQKQSSQVRVCIDDRGPGIPPAQLEAVFRPFFRVDASRSRATGGSGLGLYIARELAERNGCTLTLVNRPDGGLRAELVLPAG